MCSKGDGWSFIFAPHLSFLDRYLNVEAHSLNDISKIWQSFANS